MQLQKKYHKFYSNTIMALCLMLSLTYFGFCPQYSFGRYILVEVEKNEVTLPKSGSDLHEAEKCLEKEGISDACLSFFKTGKGHERCKDWLEENHAMVMRLDTNLKKCVNTPVLDMIQTRLRLKKDEKEDCYPGCADCTKCIYFPPLYFLCFGICMADNCNGGENPWNCK